LSAEKVETGFLWRWWLEKDEFMRNLTLSLVNSGQLEFAGEFYSFKTLIEADSIRIVNRGKPVTN
jgi:hypothetical protein